ncbi:MAG: hypothetical protein RIQ87_1068 [Chloroflexota bacterium]|jgi:glycine/D-amino acid oxidase-like deaminating enzyme
MAGARSGTTREPAHAVAWHDDAPNPTQFTTPAGTLLPAQVDWLVVGGGYAGLSAARRAAERGARVLLVDKGALRDGASSRNGGMVHVGFGASLAAIEKRFGSDGARAWLDLSRAAVARVAHLASENPTGLRATTGIDAGWSGAGHVELARSARGAAEFPAEAALRASAGLPVRLLDAAATAALTKSTSFAGALAVDEGGGVQPARLQAAMASAAQQAGVDLRERVAVQRVTRTKHGFTVTTSAGEIRAEHIFAGVNGYADAAFPALRRRAIPVGSFMIATAPLDPATLATVAGAGEMRFDTRNFLSYWRPTPDGRIAFGGRTSFWPDSLSRIARQLRTRMVEIHPELADVAVTHAWGGRLAFAFDRLPRIARLNGVTHVAGCAGSGVALMTYLAEAAMDWEFGAPMPLAAQLPWSPVPLPYEGFPWFLPLAGVGFAIEDALTER